MSLPFGTKRPEMTVNPGFDAIRAFATVQIAVKSFVFNIEKSIRALAASLHYLSVCSGSIDPKEIA
jgi:hypothetical protein